MQGNPVVHTDRSGAILNGGEAQTLMPVNPDRRGFWVQNLSAGALWLNTTGTASAGAGSMKLAAEAFYETPTGNAPVSAVSVFGAATAQAFSAKEW